MDIWNVTDKWYLERFPNIYWLSHQIAAPKIAYAVSAHRSKRIEIARNRDAIVRQLESFALIGARDHFTWNMMHDLGITNKTRVHKVADPTFLYQIRKSGAAQILNKLGVDLERPILGLLLYGHDALSRNIRRHFKARGFQIVALSMYNPYADVNLGHRMDPDQWAEVFQYLKFCLTDRFHGAIFCLKTNTPFLSIEPYPLETQLHSKQYSLLSDFDLLDNYIDPHASELDTQRIIRKCETIQQAWHEEHKEKVLQKNEEMRESHHRIISQIRELLG
jgi:polysaccharide pyruvyl transferase WcaK-like protein